MPNFFSAFSTDVFRPLATLLLPGAIGITTWVVAILWRFPAVKDLVSRNHTEVGFVFFLAMVFAGLVFEDFGARLEDRFDRWADQRTNGQHTENWNAYLQVAFKSDPIGRRYARTPVLRLKFELGVVFAMVSSGFGLIWLAALGLSCAAVLCCGVLRVAFIVSGFLEAVATHKLLSKSRAGLLGPIRVVE
jgi:hypothetical protein